MSEFYTFIGTTAEFESSNEITEEVKQSLESEEVSEIVSETEDMKVKSDSEAKTDEVNALNKIQCHICENKLMLN